MDRPDETPAQKDAHAEQADVARAESQATNSQPKLSRSHARFLARKAVDEHDREKREAEAAEQRALKKSDKRSAPAYPKITGKPYAVEADSLHNRLVRGVELFESLKAGRASVLHATDADSEMTVWFMSDETNTTYRVWRQVRNLRGLHVADYRCSCPDFQKFGRADCMHIFAERMCRDEVRVVGSITEEQRIAAKERRPPRKLYGTDGRALRSIQRTAREQVPERVPDLVRMLGDAYHTTPFDRFDGAKTDRRQVERAVALLHKVCEGVSSDSMRAVYRYHIENGRLGMKNAPHQNSISRWLNDPAITPILEKFVRMTASLFRKLESAVILDSSKFSQLMTGHWRMVEYGEGAPEARDKRPGARWMKCHALVGVESMVCFAAKFSRNAKDKDDPEDAAHDIKFFVALMEQALATLDIKTVIADKGYLAEWVAGWCWERGIQTIIPIRKKWDLATKKVFYEACKALVELFDGKRREFDNLYRWRVKVEAFFSMLKRVVDGYCVSRGRPRKDDKGKMLPDHQQPLQTAWVNETLCKTST